MKKVKTFICMAMAAALLSHSTTAVWAAVTHVEGCNNTTHKYADCKGYVTTAVVKGHDVRDKQTGEFVECLVFGDMYFHDLLCANSSCRVLMESNDVRICREWHEHCGASSRDNVCKTDYND